MKKYRAIFGLLLILSGWSQTVQLVKDINTQTQTMGPSYSYFGATLGQKIVFAGTGGGGGLGSSRVWGFDKVSNTASLIADVNVIGLFGTLGNIAVFPVDEGGLWRTDGTTEGTWPIGKGLDEHLNRVRYPMITYDNSVFFSATNEHDSMQLWRTDGTYAGTYPLTQINPTTDMTEIHDFHIFRGKLYFTLSRELFGDNQLWSSDGSVAGTQMVKDFTIGSDSQALHIHAQLGDLLVFDVEYPVHHHGLWVSDGTPQGTIEIKAFSYVGSSEVLGSDLLFSASDSSGGWELWKTDGTSAGTSRVKDINPGTADGSPAIYGLMNGKVVFSARTATSGTELWASDGTSAGTSMILELSPGSASTYFGHPSIFQNRMFFAHDDGNGAGEEIWMTDGTLAGTSLWMDINPGTGDSSSSTEVYDGYLWFTGIHDSGVRPLYQTKTLTPPTGPVGQSQSQGSYPQEMFNDNGTLYFAANDGIKGLELYKSDGTSGNTNLLKEISVGSTYSSLIKNFTKSGSNIFFTADDGVSGNELWAYNGTNTTRVKDIEPGSGGSDIIKMIDMAGTLYFLNDSSGNEGLWKSDGTTVGTQLVKGFTLGSVSLILYNNKLYFSARDAANGTEMWVSDGTTAGTHLLKDIWPGTNSSSPDEYTVSNNLIFFAATTQNEGRELWKSDGTAAGTVLVYDGAKGTTSADPQHITTAPGQPIYYTALNAGQYVVYTSDGTMANTFALSGSSITGLQNSEIAVVGNYAFFKGFTQQTGFELYKASGPLHVNATLVSDIWTGGQSSTPSYLYAMGNTLVFWAAEPVQGVSLWAYREQLWKLADTVPGAESMYRGDLSHDQNTLYFSSNDQQMDNVELYKVDVGPATFMNAPDCLCPGSNFSASVESGNMQYIWSIAGGTINSGQSTYEVQCTSTGNGPTVISCQIIGFNSLSSATSKTIEIKSNELSAPIYGPLTVCPNQSNVVFYVDPVPCTSSYTWTFPAGVSTVESHENSIRVNWGTQAGTVSLSLDRCSSIADDSTYVAMSSAGTTAQAGSDTSLCYGNSIVLTANTPGTGTGTWTLYSGPDPGLAQLSDIHDPGCTFTPGSVGNYVLRWTIPGPCSDSSDDVSITVNQMVQAHAGSDQYLTGVSQTNLEASDPSPNAGSWSVVSGPSTHSSQFASQIDPHTVFTPDGGLGSYTLRWSVNSGGCGISSDDVIISFSSTADLSLTLLPSTDTPMINELMDTTIFLTNSGPSMALDVMVQITLPVGVTLDSFQIPAIGVFDAATMTWVITDVAVNTFTLDLVLKNKDVSAKPISVEVSSALTPDPDSTPGNGVQGEDDWDDVLLTPIDAINFPDPMVRAYVINDPSIDITDDDIITSLEADGVVVFDCPNCGIHDLSGIEYFSHLQLLMAPENSISFLPELGGMADLTDMYLHDNQIETLVENGVFLLPTSLAYLELQDNKLTSFPLDFITLTDLTSLDMSGNKMGALPDIFDVIGNLISLRLSSTGMLSVPGSITRIPTLETLYLNGNMLRTLPDLSGLPQLKMLSASSNRLTSFPPLSVNASLEVVYFDNNRLTDLGDLPVHPSLLDNPMHAVDVTMNWLDQTQCPDIALMRDRAVISGAFFNYDMQGNYPQTFPDYTQWRSVSQQIFSWVTDVNAQEYFYNLNCP